MSEIDCYALCSAGHKGMYGIQGSGFAIINSDDAIDTLTEGGSGIDTFNKEMPYFPPERYEAGTLSTPSIASLLAGVKYIESCGIEHIHNKINKLTNICEQMLLSLPKVTIYGASAGIISFNIADFPSSYVADFLSENNIATRSGFHCAPLIHKKLGTEKQGAVRVSLSHLNTEAEISILYKSLKDLLNIK